VSGPLLGREPVATVSTVVALLIALLPVFGWPSSTVGVVSAALVVLGGAVSAALVSVDRALPLLVGVGKAVLAVVAAFGLHLPDNYVSAVMAVLTVVAGLATRAQVGAVQPPTDRQGREVDRNGWVVGQLDTTADAADSEQRGDQARMTLLTEQEIAIKRGEFTSGLDAPRLPEAEQTTEMRRYGSRDQREDESGRHASRTDNGLLRGRLWADPGV